MSEAMFCSIRKFIRQYWLTDNTGIRDWYITMLELIVPLEEITIQDVKLNLEVV